MSAFAFVLVAALGLATQPSWAQRIFFIIATGPSGGTYFPVGEAIAGLVSHPPGLHRCDAAGVCGPSGLIASARTSAGAIANVVDVNAHRVNSGLAQADVVAEAVAGTGAFKKIGPQRQISVIADLFPEDLHLVAAKGAHIASVMQLKGKRVSLGDPASGTIVTARAVLAAYRIAIWRIKLRELSSDVAADELEQGKLDAFFFAGGAPVGLVRDLVARGKAVLVPIDGAGRKRLLQRVPSLSTVADSGRHLSRHRRGPDRQRARALDRQQRRAQRSRLCRHPGAVQSGQSRSARSEPSQRTPDPPRYRNAAIFRRRCIPGAQRFYRESGKLPRLPVPTMAPAHRS